MLYDAILRAVPILHGDLDRAALAAHAAMLEHGFICVGATEPGADTRAEVMAAEGGSATIQILPPGWNASPDSYSFGYVHPLRGPAENFTLKALSIGGNLAVHAASSLPASELLSVTLVMGEDRSMEWREKTAASIAMRLLGRHDSTACLGKALAGPKAEAPGSTGGGTKRSAPPEGEHPRPNPLGGVGPDQPFVIDPTRPEGPGFRQPPLFWTPDSGMLLGPRHPAWSGPSMPSRGGGGMMPRFDPIGPGMGEPDPDHLRVPGMPGFPGGFPGFQGGATGGGRLDPDGMFIL